MVAQRGSTRVLIYLLRRDLRVADNPILHYLASTPASEHGFTHLLPVYSFPAHQIEVSGFCRQAATSPYPEARGQLTGLWRCGRHRAKFTAQSVWDLKTSLENLDSGLVVRVGRFESVTRDLVQGLRNNNHDVGAVWMTKEEPSEEEADERAVAHACAELGVDFEPWADEKYFFDDRDFEFDSLNDLQSVFTDFRKALEPLRERPRSVLPAPLRSQLPRFPDPSAIAAQSDPFEMPDVYADLEARLLAPLAKTLENPPEWPRNARSAHPFVGGETKANERLQDIVVSGGIVRYTKTRNELIGASFSTKLSAYLALGSLTARQIHHALDSYERGTNPRYEHVEGYGQGENEGTYGIRFELVWRDYMRLCTRRFKNKLFQLSGFRQHGHGHGNAPDKVLLRKWRTPAARGLSPDEVDPSNDPDETAATLQRFFNGTTGIGFIDASQRELFHTGYTSNRARQNVASFLAMHLSIDWRYGAEWYECMLTDYDASSNWCNWQYVAGVGNDPRSGQRIFNPIKQAFDYDPRGAYVKMWVPEVRHLENLQNVFQVCTTPPDTRLECGLDGLQMVESPVMQISFTVNRWPRGQRKPFAKNVQARRGRAAKASKRAAPEPDRDYYHNGFTNQNYYASWGSGGGYGGHGGQGHSSRSRGDFPARSRGDGGGQDGGHQEASGGPPGPSGEPRPRGDGGAASAGSSDGDNLEIEIEIDFESADEGDDVSPVFGAHRSRRGHTRSLSVG